MDMDMDMDMDTVAGDVYVVQPHRCADFDGTVARWTRVSRSGKVGRRTIRTALALECADAGSG